MVCSRTECRWKCFAACGLIGICTAYAFILVTEYFTDYLFPPVKKIAKASQTGHGTNVIAGLATGMEVPPALRGASEEAHFVKYVFEQVCQSWTTLHARLQVDVEYMSSPRPCAV